MSYSVTEQNYLNALREYQALYVKFAGGNSTGSYDRYQVLKEKVVHLAAYIRSLEARSPKLVEIKPNKFTARY